mgnify:CR=1 FL=1
MPYYYDHMYGMGGFGGFWMLIFWVDFVLFIIWIVRQVSGGNTDGKSKALDILKERYAKGEIDKKEFEEKKKDLEV